MSKLFFEVLRGGMLRGRKNEAARANELAAIKAAEEELMQEALGLKKAVRRKHKKGTLLKEEMEMLFSKDVDEDDVQADPIYGGMRTSGVGCEEIDFAVKERTRVEQKELHWELPNRPLVQRKKCVDSFSHDKIKKRIRETHRSHRVKRDDERNERRGHRRDDYHDRRRRSDREDERERKRRHKSKRN